MKCCIGCAEDKPVDRFEAGRNACRDCRATAWRERYARKEAWRLRQLEKNREYRAKNIDKVRAQKRQYEAANKDRAALRGRLFRETHAADIREDKRAYHAANATSVRDKVRDWRLRNPDKRQASNARRRARLANASGWNYTTAAHIGARVALWGGRCWMCGGAYEAVDHVIPLAAGGSHWPSNLRPICRTCNSSRPKTYAAARFIRAWREVRAAA